VTEAEHDVLRRIAFEERLTISELENQRYSAKTARR
jgi:hypothetical protein